MARKFSPQQTATMLASRRWRRGMGPASRDPVKDKRKVLHSRCSVATWTCDTSSSSASSPTGAASPPSRRRRTARPRRCRQQLRSAERAFGATLVEPSGRGVRLTDRAGCSPPRPGRRRGAGSGGGPLAGVHRRGRRGGLGRGAASAATFLLPGLLRGLDGEPIEVVCTDLDVSEAAYAALVADHDVVSRAQHRPRRPHADGLVVARGPRAARHRDVRASPARVPGCA